MNLKYKPHTAMMILGLLALTVGVLIGATSEVKDNKGRYEAIPLGNSNYVILNTESGYSRVFTVSPDGQSVNKSSLISAQ